MVSMTIRHVPDVTRDRLAQKAAAMGQSLQEYLLQLVRDDASREDPREVIARHRAALIASGGGVRMTGDEIVELVHAAREDR